MSGVATRLRRPATADRVALAAGSLALLAPPAAAVTGTLQLDGTSKIHSIHYADSWIAGGAITAWTNVGNGEVNLTPGWPRHDAASMQWLRFREANGTLYWETADGASSPGARHELASSPDPFPMTAVSFRIVAGANTTTDDTARFDNVSRY